MKTRLFLNNGRSRNRIIPAISNRVMIVGLLWHGKAKRRLQNESQASSGPWSDVSRLFRNGYTTSRRSVKKCNISAATRLGCLVTAVNVKQLLVCGQFIAAELTAENRRKRRVCFT